VMHVAPPWRPRASATSAFTICATPAGGGAFFPLWAPERTFAPRHFRAAPADFTNFPGSLSNGAARSEAPTYDEPKMGPSCRVIC
jgi:hypothetical protein